ncbi:uncharacterized protein [Gorilla gorilla gorilla]|uniref:uncharacterized protein n=1 Tax=Gorilla gorilla gorilla TaxID=9595 RepID=UPI00300AA22F
MGILNVKLESATMSEIVKLSSVTKRVGFFPKQRTPAELRKDMVTHSKLEVEELQRKGIRTKDVPRSVCAAGGRRCEQQCARARGQAALAAALAGVGRRGRAGPRVRARRRRAYLDSASRRARGRRARGPDSGGGGGRMAAARRWRQRGGRARGLVALRLGGLRLAPRPRVLPGGAAGAAERRAAAASSSSDNTSASDRVPEPALAKMAAEKERK